MKPIVSVTLQFGLINIPVKVFSAVRDDTISFKMLHGKCKTNIQQKIHCPSCDNLIGRDEIVKGYEITKGNFISITEEELEKLEDNENGKTILIKTFIEDQDVDAGIVDKTYYLGLDNDTVNEPYKLFHECLRTMKKAAIGTITMRNKEHLCAIRAGERVLLLHTLYYQNEILNQEQVPLGIDKGLVDNKLLGAATTLINSMTEPFNYANEKNRYREKVLQLIEKKQLATTMDAKTEEQHLSPVDLFEKLKQSMKQKEN